MDKKRVFVFDGSRGFSRFIKTNFSNQFEIDICFNFSKLEECFIGNYKLAFVSINSYEDLMPFAFVYGKVDFVFVCSGLNDINAMLPKLEKVVSLDLKMISSDVLITINNYLRVIDLNFE